MFIIKEIIFLLMIRKGKIMKKLNSLFLLLAASLVLSGCGGETSSSSSTSSSGETVTGDWSDDVKALMNTYCGEVLPYPQGMLTGTVTAGEFTDSYGNKFLQISDEATSYGLSNYYIDLEASDWTGIRDYNGNVKQTDTDGVEYSEFVKISDGKGYDILTFFSEAKEATEDSEATPACNVIKCFKDKSASKTDATDWSDDDKAEFKAGITVNLPFFAFGDDYTVVNPSSYPNIAAVYDSYACSLVSEYAAILVADGFVDNTAYSKVYGYPVLQKTLASGETLTAIVFYQKGNYVQVSYTPCVIESTTWPTEFFADITTKTGLTVPELTDTKNITGYEYYRKNDQFVIAAITTEEYDTAYDAELAKLGIYGSNNSYYNWEETFTIDAYSVKNDKGTAVDYFLIQAELTTPTSTFTTSWPADEISAFLTKFGVSVSVPAPTLPDGTELKYSKFDDYDAFYAYAVRYITANADDFEVDPTDTEAIKELAAYFAKINMSFTVNIKDSKYAIINSYLQSVYALAWSNQSYSTTKFEDPTGAVGIKFDGDSVVSTATIVLGSGVEHEPIFEFAKESIDVAPKLSKELPLTVDMLPYNITYTSDTDGVTVDENGTVSIAETVAIGTKATITATLTDGEGKVWTDTITVNVVKYSASIALNSVADKMSPYFTSGVAVETDEDTGEEYIFIYMAITAAYMRAYVQYYFIPSELTAGSWTYYTDEETGITYYFLECTYDDVTVTYTVYVYSGYAFLDITAEETTSAEA